MSTGFPYFMAAAVEGAQELRRNWGWFVAFGVALVLLGIAAIGSPVVATIKTVQVFAILLLIGAGVQIASSFSAPRWQGFFLHLFIGLLYLFVGTVMLERPGLSAASFTLMLAVFFVASGLVRAVFALTHHFHGWGWMALSGIITFILGAMIWRELPEAALWVIGTFVGIDLIFNGVTWIMLGMGVRQIPAR